MEANAEIYLRTLDLPFEQWIDNNNQTRIKNFKKYIYGKR